MMQNFELPGLSLASLLQSPEANTLNLNVLRRINPDINKVLACANHVALYDFDRNQHRWVRKDIEGSFFLIEKKLAPFHQIIILNKKNAGNFVEDIVPDLGFELTLPYIMYRNKIDEVIGVWFYEEEEARKVAMLLHRITEQYRAAGSSGTTTSEAAQTEQNHPQSQLTAAMPPDSTKNEHRPAREDHFWDRPIKQPAAEESSAHHLQHFGTQEALLDDGKSVIHSNPLERLLAKMKVPESSPVPTSPSVPMLQVPKASAPDWDGMESSQSKDAGIAILEDNVVLPEAASPPHAPRPALLTPTFLANAKMQPKLLAASLKSPELQSTSQPIETSDALVVPGLPLGQDNNSLTRFFAAASRSTSTQTGSPHLDAGTARSRLRQAITALSQSDAFIDVLVKELSSAGVLD